MRAERTRLARGTVLIVGAGLAGLFLALKLAPRPALILSPGPLGADPASAWAQGGLAVALAPDDSPDLHAADTIAAGAGLVDPVIARLLAAEGPARVRDLLALGVPFDRSPDGRLAQSLEAAHSRPRVARVKGDLAGRAIMEALSNAARASQSIETMEGFTACALLNDAHGAVRGVLAKNGSGGFVEIVADETVLCAGGIGGLYRVTTNPPSAKGHGLALAARAGALIADPEFVQFHPTALDVGVDPAPLATEALRGEGALLVDRVGRAFMAKHHRLGDLAPRDVVARAIHREIRDGDGAFLDARSAIGARFPEEFPTVFAACMKAGVDPRTAPIPIAPAAHYHMGGVATDLWARTTLVGLSAVGECASTGAHGANRLASNSLLEAVVFAARCAERLRDDVAEGSEAVLACAPPPELAAPDLAALRAAMFRHCGVERSAFDRAAARRFVREAIDRCGLTNALLAAAFVSEGAARRLESRGAHFCPDFPQEAAQARRSFLTCHDLELS